MGRFIVTSQAALCFFVASAFFFPLVVCAWTGPTATAPGNNTATPLNVSSVSQAKNGSLGVNGLAVFGNTLLGGSAGSNAYLNFGATAGSGGYGIFDNGGTLNFKNSGGSWQSLQQIVTILVGSSGLWTSGSGGTIYYNGGNVGINTTNPNAKLEVNGSAQFDSGLSIPPEWTGAGTLSINSNQVWSNTGGLYLQYSAPANSNVNIGGQSGVPQSLVVLNGNVTSPQYCIGASCITSWPSTTLTGPYLPVYAGWASSGTGTGGAAIYNDNGSYKKLMIVGNNSAGGSREVGIWDDLTVNGNLAVNNNATIYGTLSVSGAATVGGSTVCTAGNGACAAGAPTWASITGKPYPVNGQTWNWSGQGGQPSWLWGSNDGNNMYVWNPSNFRWRLCGKCRQRQHHRRLQLESSRDLRCLADVR